MTGHQFAADSDRRSRQYPDASPETSEPANVPAKAQQHLRHQRLLSDNRHANDARRGASAIPVQDWPHACSNCDMPCRLSQHSVEGRDKRYRNPDTHKVTRRPVRIQRTNPADPHKPARDDPNRITGRQPPFQARRLATKWMERLLQAPRHQGQSGSMPRSLDQRAQLPRQQRTTRQQNYAKRQTAREHPRHHSGKPHRRHHDADHQDKHTQERRIRQ